MRFVRVVKKVENAADVIAVHQRSLVVADLFGRSAAESKPTKLDPFNGRVNMQYASLWVKDGATEWALWRDLTAGLYQDKFNKLTAVGMRPMSISTYAVSGQVL